MSGAISFVIAGEPQGKGRARAFVRNGHVGHYTPEKTRSYEGMVRYAAMEAMGDHPLFADPVELIVSAVFSVPASWSKKKRAAALAGDVKPGKKPDMDNIIKAVTDACNRVVFVDDALIVTGSYSKVYGERPGVTITVKSACPQLVA